MWKYANDQANIDATTRSNIVHAMTKFPMDQHEIHMLPNQEELLKKDGIEEKDDQEEFSSANIPGYYWISLLKKVKVVYSRNMCFLFSLNSLRFFSHERN